MRWHRGRAPPRHTTIPRRFKGYKGPNDDEGKYPGKTIEATQNQRLKVEFSNDPLPETHLLTDSVDTAVHGTKPEDYEDRYPDWVSQFEAFGGTFAFPEVRTVTHAHGVRRVRERWPARTVAITGRDRRSAVPKGRLRLP